MKAWYRVSFQAYAASNLKKNTSVIEKLQRSSKARRRLPTQTVDVLSASLGDAKIEAHNLLIAGGGVSYVEILGVRPLRSEMTIEQCRELITSIDAEKASLQAQKDWLNNNALQPQALSEETKSLPIPTLASEGMNITTGSGASSGSMLVISTNKMKDYLDSEEKAKVDERALHSGYAHIAPSLDHNQNITFTPDTIITFKPNTQQ